MTASYAALGASYCTVAGGWWLAARMLRGAGAAPSTWDGSTLYELRRPWLEVGVALLGVAGVLAVGQIYSRGWLPKATGDLGPLVDAIEQILIFLPVLVVPFVRGQGLRTMLLPADRTITRLAVGVALALLALTVFSLVRDESCGPLALAGRIAHPRNVGVAVQVLGEDLAIGILLYRVASATSRRWTVVVVAALFALGHVPALLSTGASPSELASLGLDFALGVVMAGTVLRSGDVLWFWPVHFSLDMTQFARITGS
jgi:Type II CAAX prenyl endopeptidase Rce1-like